MSTGIIAGLITLYVAAPAVGQHATAHVPCPESTTHAESRAQDLYLNPAERPCIVRNPGLHGDLGGLGTDSARPAPDTVPEDTATSVGAGPPYFLLADRPLSPVAGATSMLAAAHGLYRLEDRILPLRLRSEDGAAGRTLGIGYRAARLVLLDLPLEAFHVVVRHEIFGHGARIRQLGKEVQGYSLPLPPPYGPGGGATEFTVDLSRTSDPEIASIAAAGLEVGTLGNSLLEERWAVRGEMDYREALHYVLTLIDNYTYIADAGTGSTVAGHDAELYTFHINRARAAVANVPPLALDPEERLDPSELQRRALLEFANPQLYYAIYGLAWRYLVGGHRTAPVPRVSVGGVHLMPRLHLWLTPVGPAYELGLLGTRENRLVALSVRVGGEPNRSMAGVGIQTTNLLLRGNFAIDGRVEVWEQSSFSLGEASGASERDMRGGLISGEVQWSGAHSRLGFVVEVGVKSKGYVPGETLDAGPVLRAGVAWRGR